MQLARLDVTSTELEDLPVLVSEEDRPLVIRVSDADAVTILAGVSAEWAGSWGVWLRASDDYPASLIARDVKTLAALMEIDHVVIEAAHDAHAHAEIVTAMLSDDEVTVHNSVATITGAYNRPAPPRPVCVWSVEEDTLVHAERVLHRSESRGKITIFRE
ncbi:MAG: hypothetical protein HKL85_02200 [Acidimicrobiaceae bacterium]|nr:hypothetical protein [Acidimicrobiaceae bacterium]